MIDRNFLVCDSCNTRIVTRTAIGHGDRQVLAFPCPECGVGITFGMTMDQKKISFSYDAKPENAHWVKSEKGSKAVVTFDTEYLVPRELLIQPYSEPFFQPSPFIMMSGHFGDLLEFKGHEALRRRWLTEVRPITSRVITHYENQNWKLFEKEVKRIDPKWSFSEPGSRFKALQHFVRLPKRWFLYYNRGIESRIIQRVKLADSVSATLTRDGLAGSFFNSGRVFEFWRQSVAAWDLFFKHFFTLSPVLQFLYWERQPPQLDDFVVCNKDLEGLKALYIACFESLARLSVLAIGLEAIIHHNDLAIPIKGKTGKLTVHEFEALSTGNKADHLRKYPISDLFLPFLDTALRNGIGHHAARYEPAKDHIVCVKVAKEQLSHWTLGYTEFCRRVMELASQLFAIELYLYAMIEMNGGRLRYEDTV